MTGRVAAVITNYNMPERADALAEHLFKSEWPLDLYLVDNGSDLVEPAKHTNVRIPKNIQTTGGWLAGLSEADDTGKEYLAYMFLITSTEILDTDPVAPMAVWLESNADAVGIHPALTHDSTTSWGQLYARGGQQPRRTWMIDNICSMYRAEWFNSIGRFDPAMEYAWGVDLETCYKARVQRRTLWVDERVQVRKVTNIAYSMNRMNMSADERGARAGANMRDVLFKKYGPAFWEKMTKDLVTDDIR